jgi:hypothetical protein
MLRTAGEHLAFGQRGAISTVQGDTVSNLRCYLPKSDMPPVRDWENKCSAPPSLAAPRSR